MCESVCVSEEQGKPILYGNEISKTLHRSPVWCLCVCMCVCAELQFRWESLLTVFEAYLAGTAEELCCYGSAHM